MKVLSLATLVLSGLAFAGQAADLPTTFSSDDLPEKKRTVLGLYLTPQQAADALAADPSIVFIDVRDPVEAQFVGHAAPTDAIVPLRLVTDAFNAERGGYKMAPNPSFLDDVAAVVAREGRDKDAPLFVTCQSGGRTAAAVNKLAEAGYGEVYALFEGIEGDLNKETGRRDLNGWKNAGLDWSFKLRPEQAWTAAR